MKWIQDNWLIVVVVAGLAFVAWNQQYSGSLYDKLMVSYNQQNVSHQVQIQAIEKANTKWRQKQDELNKKHAEEMQQIETSFQEQLSSISKQQQVYRRRLVKAAKKDPQTLMRELNRIYGIPIYNNSTD